MNRPHDIPRLIGDAQAALADFDGRGVFAHREVIAGLPNVRWNRAVHVSSRGGRVRGAGEFPRLVDALSPSLDVPATEVQQPEPDQQSRHERALSERSRERDGAFGERDRVLPLADPGRVLISTSAVHTRKSGERASSAKAGEMQTSFLGVSGEPAGASLTPVRGPRDPEVFSSVDSAIAIARRRFHAPDRSAPSTGSGVAAHGARANSPGSLFAIATAN